MRSEIVQEKVHEFQLPGGCIICGGELAVRMTPSGAGTVCVECRWISRPQVSRGEDGVEVLHPAAIA
jgi:hypothetical protein